MYDYQSFHSNTLSFQLFMVFFSQIHTLASGSWTNYNTLFLKNAKPVFNIAPEKNSWSNLPTVTELNR